MDADDFPVELTSHFNNLAGQQIQHPAVQRLARVLEGYEKFDTLMLAAGLLVNPSLQANNYRIELLVQLIVASCKGRKKPTWKHLGHWLNRQLSAVAWAEDPPEDVFVSSVSTQIGSFLVLGGLWETPDSSTQLLINSIEQGGGDEQLGWLAPAYALLALSDLIIKKAKLKRWHLEQSIPKQPIPFIKDSALQKWGQHLVIHISELEKLGITIDLIEPFILLDSQHANLVEQSNQANQLQEKPCIRFGDKIIVALPNAISYAVRRHIVRQAHKASQLAPLETALMNNLIERLDKSVTSSSRYRLRSLELPEEHLKASGVCLNLVYKLGKQFLHISILPDSLETFSMFGISQPTELNQAQQDVLEKHIASLRSHLEEDLDFHQGHTLQILGHLGQGFAFTPPENNDRWTFTACRANDLETILQGQNAPLNKLVFLLSQRVRMEQEGLTLPNINNLPNLFAYWEKERYSLWASDIPFGQKAYLQIATDFVTRLRADRRSQLDEHCVVSVSGGMTTVMRSTAHSVFEVLKKIPTYVSLTHLKNGFLSFYIDHNGVPIWITVLGKNTGRTSSLIVHLWEELQLLTHQFLEKFPDMDFPYPAVEIILDMRSVSFDSTERHSREPDALTISFHKKKPVAKILAKQSLVADFYGVSNQGERAILSHVIYALQQLSSEPYLSFSECHSQSAEIMGEDTKLIHTLEIYNPVEYLISSNPSPTFQQPDEHVHSVHQTAFIWMTPCTKKRVLNPISSKIALNRAVTDLAEQIRKMLSQFKRQQLLIELLSAHETLLREKARWRSTARAVRALYGVQGGTQTAEKEERERAVSQLTLRALVEAAICECPNEEGKAIDSYSIDELFGLMCTLIDLGRNSEIIHHGLSETGITVHPSGAYFFSPSIFGEIGQKYSMESFDATYTASAADYENYVAPIHPEEKAPASDREVDSGRFQKAFQAEYHFSFDSLLDIVAALFDSAIESESVVKSVTILELINLCEEKGISSMEVHAFINSFALPSRPIWNQVPSNIRAKDIQPWSFERKLSMMLRPLIECQAKAPKSYLFGVGALRDSIGYVIDSLTKGRFDDKAFSSREMKAYIGHRSEALGKAFTERVADRLRELGWEVRTEIKMSALGAGKQPDLGDVDVLAWKNNGEILAIECKRLKKARTVSEIALVCDRFKGNVGDLLFKHIRRTAWLNNNHEKLASFLGVNNSSIRMRTALVTSAPVPFRYTQNLPIPPDQIWFFHNLGRHV